MILKVTKHLFAYLLISLVVFLLYDMNRQFELKIHAQKAVPQQEKIVKIQNVYEKLKDKSFLRILVVGDSIGEGDGQGVVKDEDKWAKKLANLINKEFGSISFIDYVTIGGATVFGGWTDYNRSYLKDQYDLVFICFGQNDQGSLNKATYGKYYEKLVRSIKTEKANPEVIGIIESSIQSDGFPDELKKVAQYYNFPSIDTRISFKKSGIDYDKLTNDGVHPNSTGYNLYANDLFALLQDNVVKGRVVLDILNKPYLYDSDSDKSSYLISTFTTNVGFEGTSNGLTGDTAGEYLETAFKGTSLGLMITRDIGNGILNVYIDNKKMTEIDCSGPFKYRNVILIDDNLLYIDHKLRLEVSDKSNSTGNVVNVNAVVTNSKP